MISEHEDKFVFQYPACSYSQLCSQLQEDIIGNAMVTLQHRASKHSFAASKTLPSLLHQLFKQPSFLIFRTGTLPISDHAKVVRKHRLFTEYQWKQHSIIELHIETLVCWNPDTLFPKNRVLGWPRAQLPICECACLSDRSLSLETFNTAIQTEVTHRMVISFTPILVEM